MLKMHKYDTIFSPERFIHLYRKTQYNQLYFLSIDRKQQKDLKIASHIKSF